uniref:G-protein coupled receptors family 1 profile domain-containing protein n=1 Tax=Monopterus albus TaxID=43700 RepID=A0A3Q3JEX3_MONAL
MGPVILHGNSSSSHSSVNTQLLSQDGYNILAVIMGVFSVVGIILDVLVIPLSYALVNLAICDLGCAVFGGLPTTITSAMGYFSLGGVGCILEAFAVAFFGESGVKISCAPNWNSRDVGNISYSIIYFFLSFVVPFSIIMVSYLQLLWTLCQVTKLQVSDVNCVEVQVARIVAVMVLTFLVTWLPYAAMALAVMLDSSLYIDPVIATVPVYLAKSSTVYNPIVYVFMNRQVILRHAHLCSQKQGETTVVSLNKRQKVSPRESLND